MTRPTVYITQSEDRPRMCPVCRTVLDGVTALGDTPEHRVPKPGDQTCCAYCGSWLTVTPENAFRVASQAEVDALPPLGRDVAEHIHRAQARWKQKRRRQ